MKSLVLFESAFGNTERIARAIFQNLGKYGEATLMHATEASSAAIDQYDLLVIGSPTQYRKASPTMRGWLEGLPYKGLSGFVCAVYDTRYDQPLWRSGSAGRMLGRQVQKLGGVMLVEPESFFVSSGAGELLPGELERVSTWVNVLHQAHENLISHNIT